MMDEKQRLREVYKVTIAGSIINVLLLVLKFAAGILGHSAAMIADAIHSLTDFATDVVVLVFVKLGNKPKDKDHDYGHGKYETLATAIIGISLFVVGVMICYSGVTKTYRAICGETVRQPGVVALIAALVSIVMKEWAYQFTVKAGKKYHSEAVVANAWHHRSDAFSSIAVLVGIGCAMFLGERWRVLDPIAAATVSVFIALVAYRLAMPSIRELLEVALPDDVTAEMGGVIGRVDGVCAYHHLRTRKNGNVYIMDFHIKVDPRLTIVEAHDISKRAEAALKAKYGEQSIVNIHIEPYQGETVDSSKSCTD